MFSVHVVVLGFVASVVSQSCYYPDGSLPSDYAYVPCTGDSASSCCIPSEGDVCLESGLCYWAPGQYPFRGACTDQSWDSPNCPHYCMSDRPNEWQEMVECSSGKEYCCSQEPSNRTCCNDATQVFSVDINAVINRYSASATPTASSVGLAPIPSGHFDNPTASGASTATATVTMSSSPSASESSNPPVISASSKTIAIAVGVAIPGTLIAVILSCCIFFERRRRQHRSLLGQSGRRPRPGHSSKSHQGAFAPQTPQPMQVSSPTGGPPAYSSRDLRQVSELPDSSRFGTKGDTSLVHEAPA